jgi:hypothetical protein
MMHERCRGVECVDLAAAFLVFDGMNICIYCIYAIVSNHGGI